MSIYFEGTVELQKIQNKINEYTRSKNVFFSSKLTEDHDDISKSIAIIKCKLIDQFFSEQRSIDAREAKALGKLYVEVLLTENSFGEDYIGQLIYREPLFDRNTPSNVLHGIFHMNKLKKHCLFSENHSNKGYHVHLLNKSRERYKVIFTAVTSSKNFKNYVYWEPHAEGRTTLNIDIPSQGKSVRVEIYDGVVELLSNFSNRDRKKKSKKSQQLSTV
ncbi:hypothetical protein [Shewanella algae]|uniref:hypothetical protein n=1 Tax=Shewanella algae TaxID=38313 RepID=UPI003AAF77E4